MKERAIKRERTRSSGGAIWSVAKGTILSLCISLVGVLVFAFCLKFTSLSDKLITPINEVIKGLSILIGVFVGLRKQKKFGLLCGLVVGLLYTIFAFVIFSLLSGSFIFDKTLMYDVIFGSIIGAICGIICVNLKKSAR